MTGKANALQPGPMTRVAAKTAKPKISGYLNLFSKEPSASFVYIPAGYSLVVHKETESGCWQIVPVNIREFDRLFRLTPPLLL